MRDSNSVLARSNLSGSVFSDSALPILIVQEIGNALGVGPGRMGQPLENPLWIDRALGRQEPQCFRDLVGVWGSMEQKTHLSCLPLGSQYAIGGGLAQIELSGRSSPDSRRIPIARYLGDCLSRCGPHPKPSILGFTSDTLTVLRHLTR